MARETHLSSGIGQGTMHMFLSRALEKILKDTPKKQTALRDACQDAIGSLQQYAEEVERGQHGHAGASSMSEALVNKIVAPLKLACESRQSKIMTTALDCFQKLMAYGYLRGNLIDAENPNKKLMDKVLDTIGQCFDFPDDNVQLQIIKAFLTAVSSPACDVHEAGLMTAVRTCYNIFLVSRDPVNQTTAKATLTQMLHIIFQRLESAQRVPRAAFAPIITSDVSESPQAGRELNLSPVVLTGDGSDVPAPPTDSAANGSEAVLSLQEPAADDGEDTAQAASTDENAVLFADCFLIFRALCKLSMKELPENTSADSLDMRSKALSLELLLSILENSGPVFRNNEKFINHALKKYLCISLLMNGVSPVPKVFRLSLSLFLTLVSNFKDHLKTEIGVFFTKIFLRILESTNSTIQQKWMVLQVLYKICKNPQTLVDIFLNYDCALDEKDIFERMTNDLSVIAKGSGAADQWTSPAQELAMRTLGLECLVTIMKSLVDWSKELGAPAVATADQPVADQSDEPAEPAPPPAVDSFGEAKAQKMRLEQGKAKFNVSSRKGLQYLMELGLLQNTPEDISRFFITTDGLDKSKIGDYLGSPDPFNLRVLHAYCDAMSFAGMDIDRALRKFLSGFRLPGESQKIDRIMEKFAERYYNDNPTSLFANADAAYVLAYSIIMLATDLHNPVIRVKITKEQWRRNNKGINDGKDLPDKFQDDIYDRIAAEPLSLKDDDEVVTTAGSAGATAAGSTAATTSAPATAAASGAGEGPHGPSDELGRGRQWYLESKQLVKRSQELLREKLKKKTPYYKSRHLIHVRPMFEICWCPMLAAFSVLLESSDDPRAISLCLEGFRAAVHVACLFFLETERNTFVSTLAKFTHLSNFQEIKPKNLDCIKTLIAIANEDGNLLQDSWFDVLKCISQLERMHLIGSGVKAASITETPAAASGSSVSAEPASSSSSPSGNIRPSLDGSRGRAGGSASAANGKPAFEGFNASIIASQLDTSAIDRLFTNSVQLSDNAIVDFVECLCAVSLEEIDTPSPRIFSLQKLVEIAYYNMERIRLVWSRIWKVMSSHFMRVGTDHNLTIAMYAVDSLRQLSMKFLEKDELANYHFQKDFLRPFEWILTNNPAREIRELVVRCLTQMILARASNIRSGWKAMFLAFSAAAADTDPMIVGLAFDTVESIQRQYFGLVADQFFVDCVNCLAAYANSSLFRECALRAIDAVGECARQLAEGAVAEGRLADGELYSDADAHIKLWFPILTALSRTVAHPVLEVRSRALDQLFRILRVFGERFDTPLWELIFRGVLLPIFDNVRYASGNDSANGTEAVGGTSPGVLKEDNEWLTSTCHAALRALLELFSHFFQRLSFLLGDLQALLVSCVLQDNESLARIGADCLLALATSNGALFDEAMWTRYCDTMLDVFRANCPAAAGDSSPSSVPPAAPSTPSRTAFHVPRSRSAGANSSLLAGAQSHGLDYRTTHGRVVVQLLLLQGVQELVAKYYNVLALSHLRTLLDCLVAAFQFAHAANNSASLRSILGSTGLVNLMIKLEMDALDGELCILVRLFAQTNDPARLQFAEERLWPRFLGLMRDYIATASADAHSSYSLSKTPLLVKALTAIAQFTPSQFEERLDSLYPLWCDLLLSESAEVRKALRPLFLRVGSVYSLCGSTQQ